MQITIKAKELEIGDVIVQKSGAASIRFTVDSFGLWDRDQVRVSCDDDSIVFWFDANEDVRVSRPVTAYFFTHSGSCGHYTGFTTMAAARVAANQWLAESDRCFPKAYVEILSTSDGAEIMRHTSALDSWYFPLADISRMVAVPFTPNDRLARHFQMAGAVEQDNVERLATAMSYPGGVVARRLAACKALYG